MVYKSIQLEKDSSFLVTGGAGFIGSNLCEFLINEGYKVTCLDNLSTGKLENIDAFFDNPLFDFIEGDITQLDVCLRSSYGVDYVLHQAAWGSVPRSIELPLYYEKVNIQGTLNMLEASRENKVKKFVYASSSSVYGDSSYLPKKEGQEGNLLSPYSLTKKVNEEYAKLYTKLYNLDTYGLRYFNVFGKRQDTNSAYAAVIPQFVNNLIHNQRPTIYGDGNQSRDFTYIDNVIEANLNACKAPSSSAGEVYNIAFGERETLIKVYYTISSILHKNIEPIMKSERVGDIKHSHADISKAKKMLGYSPKWDFERGILSAIEWYKNYFEKQ